VRGGGVIAIGATAANTTGQQGVFLRATPNRSLTAAPASAQPIPLPRAAIPEVSVTATAQAGGQQVAVGSANGYPAIWRRTGEGPWSLMTQRSQFASPEQQGVTALTGVTHGRAGWLAVGGNLILTSPDGETWRVVGGMAAPAAADLLAAAAGPAGYVVTGEQNGEDGPVPVAIWLSADLNTWTTATGTGNSGQMRAVTADAGGFVAVGSVGSQPAVWVSAGGQAWKLTDLSPAGATMNQVAAIGNRVVIMGANAAGEPFALLSTNGATTWQALTLPLPARAAPGSATAVSTVTALTAGPDGFTALGETGGPGDQQILAWTSQDGAVWTLSHVGSAGGTRSITALAGTGSAVSGIGQIATEQSQQSVLWTSR
jgi:hypothetical protein